MKEIPLHCPSCLTNYNKGVKLQPLQWTVGDLENNILICPHCKTEVVIEKDKKGE